MRSKSARTFDLRAFLDSPGIATKTVACRRGEAVYAQGDASASVMYIREGGVKLSVVSKMGKEAVVAMLGPGDFFGEGCLAGQAVRMGSATAITQSTIVVLTKARMTGLLHTTPELADRFIAHMLGTNIRIEEDMIDQLFNHDEKRLARTLLRLARYGTQDKPRRLLPRMSRQTLARMAGTSRPKADYFMRKFKRLGFIEDREGLTINKSLLSVVLRE